jgi:hypothetical protein
VLDVVWCARNRIDTSNQVGQSRSRKSWARGKAWRKVRSWRATERQRSTSTDPGTTEIEMPLLKRKESILAFDNGCE